MAYSFVKGTVAKATDLPDICCIVAYHEDGTYELYNRQGDQLVPIRNLNADKWDRISLPAWETKMAEVLHAKEVHILKTNSQRNTNGVSFN